MFCLQENLILISTAQSFIRKEATFYKICIFVSTPKPRQKISSSDMWNV